jgi:putative transposase
MTDQLVTDALMMAGWRGGRPQEVFHHSDQGSQYTSDQSQRLMDASGVVCLMAVLATVMIMLPCKASSLR